MTLQSRAISPRKSATPTADSNRRLLAIYRAQMSSLIELEREIVERGLIRPEDRRLLSREERRVAGEANTNGRKAEL